MFSSAVHVLLICVHFLFPNSSLFQNTPHAYSQMEKKGKKKIRVSVSECEWVGGWMRCWGSREKDLMPTEPRNVGFPIATGSCPLLGEESKSQTHRSGFVGTFSTGLSSQDDVGDNIHDDVDDAVDQVLQQISRTGHVTAVTVKDFFSART